MTRHACPSPLFPAPPEIAVTVPDGWTPKPIAGGLMTFAGPVEAGFQANVVITASRVPPDADLDTVAGWTRDGAAGSLSGFEVIAEGQGQVDGHPAVLRAITFTTGSGQERRLYQAQVLLLVPGAARAKTAHLVRFEGTCAVEASQGLTDTFRQIARSLQVKRSPSSPARRKAPPAK